MYKWFCSISSGLELEHLAGEYENRGFLKIMALGLPNAKSYAQPVTLLAIIKTNAETLHVCHNRDKHPEFRAEIQDLMKVVKDLENMQRLRVNLMCPSQLEKEPPNSFFEQCVYSGMYSLWIFL